MKDYLLCVTLCLMSLPISATRMVPSWLVATVERVEAVDAQSVGTFVADVVEPAPEFVANTESVDSGKKSKDKKKKKNSKEVKSPEEVIAMIKAFEWTKPPMTGTKLDEYYSSADEYFKLINEIDNEVHLFKVCRITSPSGESTIAPVDIRTGAVRHKNEASSQVIQSVGYGSKLAVLSSSLTMQAVGCADLIAKDAIPMIGDPVRKKANVQIAKSVKVFPLLKKLIDSQRNMMDRYFKANANVESTDSVSEAIAMGDIDFMEAMEMSDEELAAYMEAEENAAR